MFFWLPRHPVYRLSDLWGQHRKDRTSRNRHPSHLLFPMTKFLFLLIVLYLVISLSGDRFKECEDRFGCDQIEELSDKRIRKRNSDAARAYTVDFSGRSFEKLKVLLSENGYGEWKTGGLTYGHIDEGWSPGEKQEFTQKDSNGTSLTVAISPLKNRAYFIEFPAYDLFGFPIRLLLATLAAGAAIRVNRVLFPGRAGDVVWLILSGGGLLVLGIREEVVGDILLGLAVLGVAGYSLWRAKALRQIGQM